MLFLWRPSLGRNTSQVHLQHVTTHSLGITTFNVGVKKGGDVHHSASDPGPPNPSYPSDSEDDSDLNGDEEIDEEDDEDDRLEKENY